MIVWLLWLLAMLLLGMALFLLWPCWSKWRGQRRLEQDIIALGEQHLRDVMLEDGMGGYSYFEWLLLTEQGVCLLISKGQQGNIFAGERLEKWSQVVGSRSYYFTNPLYELEPLSATLRYHLPGTPIQGLVLFSGQCFFPKGQPDAVLTREQLPGERVPGSIPVKLQQAWQRLEQRARPVDPDSEAHLLPTRDSSANKRMGLAVAVTVLATLVGGMALWLG